MAPSVWALLTLVLALNTEVCAGKFLHPWALVFSSGEGGPVVAIPTPGVLVNAKQDTNMLQEIP